MTTLVGPSKITISAASGMGPLAGETTIAIVPRRVTVVNAGDEPVSLTAATFDPCCAEDDGATAAAQLAASCEDPEPVTIAPGESTALRVTGTVPARANQYTTSLRLRAQSGELLAIPTIVKVAAWSLWGIALMLFGLCTVGVLTTLLDASESQKELRAVLHYRQDIHEYLEKSPPPENQAQDVVALDENLSSAIAILRGRRSFSVIDRRVGEANERFEEAKSIADRLRKAQTDKRPGQVEVELVRNEWNELRERFKSLDDSGGDGILLPARLGAAGMGGWSEQFLARFQNDFIRGPLRELRGELSIRSERVELEYGAGNWEQATRMATALRRWMRRASSEIDDRLATETYFAVRAGEMAVDEGWIRQRAAFEGLSPIARTSIAGLLDQGIAKLASCRALADFAAVSALFERAQTELTLAEAEAVKAEVAASLHANDAETDIDGVTRVINESMAQADKSPAGKLAGKIRIFEAWRARLAVVKDVAERAELTAHVDAAIDKVQKGDLEGAVAESHAIRDGWDAHVKRRVAELANEAIAFVCDRWRVDLRRHLDHIETSLRLMGPRQQTAEWEASLDRLRNDQLEIRADRCLDGIVPVGERTNRLDQDIFSVTLADTAIPADTRVETATKSGIAEAIDLTRKLATEPRKLEIVAQTPPDEMYVGRTISWSVGNLAQPWKQGIAVRFDFRDGKPPLMVDAERLTRNHQIDHVFIRPGQYKVVAKVAEAFGAEGRVTTGTLLGEGETSIGIDPSPVSKAAELANAFLNLRFVFALLIASTLYYWRFHAKRDRVFGIRSFDYAEAYALGFLVASAANDLPKALEKFVGG